MVLAGVVALTGCQTGGGGGFGAASPSNAIAIGDWDDVEAAVLVGAPKAEAVILDSTLEGNEYIFRLKTVRDEPGRLVARRDAATAGQDPGPIHLSATIGLFGNPEAERRLLRAVRDRLEALAGVSYRAIR